jgi:hypothetical protein
VRESWILRVQLRERALFGVPNGITESEHRVD